MPAPGDQHQSWKNPFEEPTPRMSIWTAQDIATIASKLDKQLGPEYISARAGPGGQRVHYLTAEKCITLANEVFGFNGWSSSIQNIQVDFADENPQTQRVSIGLSVIVRVTLKDGTYHEDIGYGSTENAKGKAMAFEKAKKEGTTDGLKRALRSFGNVLGNCIYDQNYVKQVVKHKAEPVKKFDPNNLHRHADFVAKEEAKEERTPKTTVPEPQTKLEPSESFEDFLGELDEVDFCVQEDGHPDEIMLPGPDAQTKPQPQVHQPANQPATTASSGASGRAPQTPSQPQQRPDQHNGGSHQRLQAAPQTRPPTNQQPSGPSAGPAPQVGESVGFFSAKAVNHLPESNFQGQGSAQLAAPHGHQAFNPKLESPSIRKTPGIDHTSTKPVGMNGQHVPPRSSQAQTSNGNSLASARPSGAQPPRSSNVVNPTLDHTRRIGAPTGPGSPLSNRGSFRQPTMKRPPPAEGQGANISRPALADIPANAGVNPNAATADGLEAKRQRTA